MSRELFLTNLNKTVIVQNPFRRDSGTRLGEFDNDNLRFM